MRMVCRCRHHLQSAKGHLRVVFCYNMTAGRSRNEYWHLDARTQWVQIPPPAQSMPKRATEAQWFPGYRGALRRVSTRCAQVRFLPSAPNTPRIAKYDIRARSGSSVMKANKAGTQPGPRLPMYARVSEWFKEKTCKVFIRKFKSCPVLQRLYYNQLVKTKYDSQSLRRFSLSKPPPRWGLFGGYRMAI